MLTLGFTSLLRLLRWVGFWGSCILLNWDLLFCTWHRQEESDSERESNDAPGSRKPVKRKREKLQLNVSKDPVQSQSVTSSDGCLSLLKKRRIDGKIHVVVSPLFFFLSFFFFFFPSSGNWVFGLPLICV